MSEYQPINCPGCGAEVHTPLTQDDDLVLLVCPDCLEESLAYDPERHLVGWCDVRTLGYWGERGEVLFEPGELT